MRFIVCSDDYCRPVQWASMGSTLLSACLEELRQGDRVVLWFAMIGWLLTTSGAYGSLADKEKQAVILPSVGISQGIL